MKLTGTQGWVDSSKVDECEVKEAIIRNNDKEIVIDYEYQGQKQHIKLFSKDGIRFTGEYGLATRKIGSCDFTLYKNTENYFLFGGYSSAEDENGIWWIELRSQE